MIDKAKATNKYFRYLYNMKQNMINQTYAEKNIIWVKAYEETISKGINANNLPQLLALVHPDFYFNEKGEDLSDILSWKRTGKFSSDISETSICVWGYDIGLDCIFNENRHIRGKCQADHYWPNYLGGPSIKENRLVLCKYHNNMKGSDILNYNWDLVPSWLENYLNRLYNLKRSNK